MNLSKFERPVTLTLLGIVGCGQPELPSPGPNRASESTSVSRPSDSYPEVRLPSRADHPPEVPNSTAEAQLKPVGAISYHVISMQGGGSDIYRRDKANSLPPAEFWISEDGKTLYVRQFGESDRWWRLLDRDTKDARWKAVPKSGAIEVKLFGEIVAGFPKVTREPIDSNAHGAAVFRIGAPYPGVLQQLKRGDLVPITKVKPSEARGAKFDPTLTEKPILKPLWQRVQQLVAPPPERPARAEAGGVV